MFERITPVVKNLLIANIAVYILGYYIVPGLDLPGKMAFWHFQSPNFQPYQLVTYMFAHGGFSHILFNMLGLVFLGPLLESLWGPKKFLTFYILTGVVAAILYSCIIAVKDFGLAAAANDFIVSKDPEDFYRFISKHWVVDSQMESFYELFYDNPNDPALISKGIGYVNQIRTMKVNVSMVGASGSVYGILMGIALLFPNLQMMLLFLPVPIKAKYMALGLAFISLYSGISDNPGDNVAHFAHLGGMIGAYILIRLWRKSSTGYY